MIDVVYHPTSEGLVFPTRDAALERAALWKASIPPAPGKFREIVYGEVSDGLVFVPRTHALELKGLHAAYQS